MTRQFILLTAVFSSFAFCSAARADLSLGVRAGTLGAGAELGYAISPRIGLRLNADAGSKSGTNTEHDIDYDYKLKLRTAALTGDWFPFANNFRLSLAGFYNGNKITLHGRPTGGTFNINGQTFSAAEVGALDADVDFNKFAPYLGLGYGRAINRGFSVTFDAGVL